MLMGSLSTKAWAGYRLALEVIDQSVWETLPLRIRPHRHQMKPRRRSVCVRIKAEFGIIDSLPGGRGGDRCADQSFGAFGSHFGTATGVKSRLICCAFAISSSLISA